MKLIRDFRVQVHRTVLEWMKEHGFMPPLTSEKPMNEARDSMDDDIDFWGDDLN